MTPRSMVIGRVFVRVSAALLLLSAVTGAQEAQQAYGEIARFFERHLRR